MSTVTVVAKIVANEEAIESVKTELLKMILPTRREPGCLEYRLHV
jgi:quinol monooxygenase YgiN